MKDTTTADKTNVIANNLIHMYECDWILADVFFLSGISGSSSVRIDGVLLTVFSSNATIEMIVLAKLFSPLHV